MEIDGRRVYVRTGNKTQTVNICGPNGQMGEYDFIYRFYQPGIVDQGDFDLDSSTDEFRAWLLARGGKEERALGGATRAVHLRRSNAVAPASLIPQGRRPSDRDVFVVHGRDLEARDAVFGFLRTLDLRPLEWNSLAAATGRGAPYIGEILESAFSQARAVVVLLTPDDEARLRSDLNDGSNPSDSDFAGQARANVLFEAGTAFATHPDRTVLVEIGALRPWSDVSGRHIVRLDGDVGGLHTLAGRLRSAGCAVNTDGSQWLDTKAFKGLRALKFKPDSMS